VRQTHQETKPARAKPLSSGLLSGLLVKMRLVFQDLSHENGPENQQNIHPSELAETFVR
jgi:hypothetical protein